MRKGIGTVVQHSGTAHIVRWTTVNGRSKCRSSNKVAIDMPDPQKPDLPSMPSDHLQELARTIRGLGEDLASDDSGSVPAPAPAEPDRKPEQPR